MQLHYFILKLYIYLSHTFSLFRVILLTNFIILIICIFYLFYENIDYPNI